LGRSAGAIEFGLFRTRYKHIHVGSAVPIQGTDGPKQSVFEYLLR